MTALLNEGDKTQRPTLRVSFLVMHGSIRETNVTEVTAVPFGLLLRGVTDTRSGSGSVSLYNSMAL